MIFLPSYFLYHLEKLRLAFSASALFMFLLKQITDQNMFP